MKGQDINMTYEEIVGKALIVYAKADATEITGHLAIQFNVWGEGEGAFYLEVSDGKVDIQPYEYYDRNAIITVSSDILVAILDGKLSMDDAYNDNKVQVDGDLGAALLLKKIVVKPVPKKAAPKKATAAKKPAAKKPATKKAATAKKETAKKTTAAKKPATKKATK